MMLLNDAIRTHKGGDLGPRKLEMSFSNESESIAKYTWLAITNLTYKTSVFRSLGRAMKSFQSIYHIITWLEKGGWCV